MVSMFFVFRNNFFKPKNHLSMDAIVKMDQTSEESAEIKKACNEMNEEVLASIESDMEKLLVDIYTKKQLDTEMIKDIMHFTEDIQETETAPYEIVMSEKVDTIEENNLLISFIDKLASKGVGIQRYKGLGEMNPDQLWETTMDPMKRALLQIKLEDSEIADEIFTILMGSDVAPRKNFIETYARKVKWLDV